MRLSRLSWLMAGLLFTACARKPANEPELPLPALRVALSSEATIGQLGAGTEIVRRPWVGPIIQVLAVETPDGVAPFPQQRIAGARMTTEALFEHALANLRAACPQPILGDRTVKMAKANVQISRFADNHTAARLLLPEPWSKIAADGGGSLFAAAPARDIVVWTTSADENEQRALRGQARTAFQSRSYPISPAILRWTGSGWSLEDPNPIPAP
jgi:hypothetical protein